MAQLLIMGIMGFVNNYILLIIFTIVFAFHNNTFFSFQDGLAVNIANKENKVYSNTRIFGTAGYLLGTLIGGSLIDISSFGIVFLIAGCIYAIVELLFFFIKVEDEEKREQVPITFKQVLIHKQYVFYLIAYVLILGTWNIEEAYVSLTFANMGVTTSYWGYILAYQIFIEMVVIFIINLFFKKKFSPKSILLIAFGLIGLRSLFLGLDMYLWIKVFLVASLRGLSWGLFLSFHMELVRKILPNELVTKAVLIFAICSNIFATSGNYLAPYIYQALSFNAMYLILMILQILGLVVYLIFVFFRKDKNTIINVEE